MSGDTPRRTIRVETELWAAAIVIAARRGESLTAVVRRALAKYVEEDEWDCTAGVACPLCGAKPGRGCTWPNGKLAGFFHPARAEAAKA